MDKMEWQRQYEAYLAAHYGLTIEEARSVFDSNLHDFSKNPEWMAVEENGFNDDKSLINVILALGGKELVLRALGWRPVNEVFPDSHLANNQVPHWVPTYGGGACFPQDEAIKVAFHAHVWIDMAKANGFIDKN